MKKSSLSTIIMMALAITTSSQAQVGIGVETANVDASAKLEVASTTKGFLPPRMTNHQKVVISSPAAGLVLWCTNCGAKGELQVYNGTEWTNMNGGPVSPAPVSIGDAYQGGIVFYIFKEGDPEYDAAVRHGLISETQDQGDFSSWYDAQNKISLSSNHSIDGQNYTDWRLPTKDELNLLYLQKAEVGNFMLNTHFYWSSSEGLTPQNDNYSWGQFFTNGNQQYYDNIYGVKVGEQSVRAVRSF